MAQSERGFSNLFYSSGLEPSVVSIIDAWAMGYGDSYFRPFWKSALWSWVGVRDILCV